MPDSTHPNRRQVLTAGSALAGAATLGSFQSTTRAAGPDTIKIGLVGCGGRGNGAAIQALTAEYNTRLTAVADVFDGKVEFLVKNLQRSKVANQVARAPENLFVGLDGYQKVIDSGVDVVLLATPPGFRP
ncbi:MAG: hypothetical protein ACYTGQ_14075, partial [Planctomycetota bacterium]